MVSVGILYFVGDSIKPFQSQNKHHNINPPPSPTYPPHHPMPHAFIAPSETETNDMASHRISSLRIKARKNQRTTHLPTPQTLTVSGFSQCLNNRLIIIIPKLYYVFFFFFFLKCYLLLYPVKALAIKIGLGFRFCILRTRDYYCDDEGRGSCFATLALSLCFTLVACSLC